MWCSTASTTTIASSTTMPMASTRPKSVRLFRLKPSAAITAKVPTIATGTATSGISADRQFWRNNSTTKATRMTASRSVLKTSSHRLDDERRRVVSDRVVHPLGEPLLQLLHLVADQVGGLQGVGPGALVDRERHGGPAVERAGLVVALGAQLDARHVAEPHHAPLGVGLQDHVRELLDVLQPAQRGDRELERLPGGDRRLAELAGRNLDVLLVDRR